VIYLFGTPFTGCDIFGLKVEPNPGAALGTALGIEVGGILGLGKGNSLGSVIGCGIGPVGIPPLGITIAEPGGGQGTGTPVTASKQLSLIGFPLPTSWHGRLVELVLDEVQPLP
jgi:hypothetical protein